jgi:hypothetical protein
LPEKRRKQIPHFELKDIMGSFDLDDQGNFIIVKSEAKTGILEDRDQRRVNPKGYLLDRLGNVITREGVLIFYANELDPFGEIPPPFSFDLKKQHLLNAESNSFSLDERAMESGNKIGVT